MTSLTKEQANMATISNAAERYVFGFPMIAFQAPEELSWILVLFQCKEMFMNRL